MRGAMLFAAGLFVGLAVHVGMAQNAGSGVVMMNHVGINVPNIAGGGDVLHGEDGLSRGVPPQRRQGTAEAGLHADQQEHVSRAQSGERGAARPASRITVSTSRTSADAVARFRKSGVTVSDPNTSDTKAILANITDPYMGRIELARASAGVPALQGH